MILDCAGKPLDLSRPHVMGILNVTPDSFSDGGDFVGLESALARARQMVEEGATIIDVGGESTRPGAAPVDEQQELDRVIPVLEAIHSELSVIVSIDTSKAVVMGEAVAAGAGMINDVYALRLDGALESAVKLAVPVCLMHMQGEPRSMQASPDYSDVVTEVMDFLTHRAEACVEAGLPREKILLDPGFGFGKALTHNLQLLKHLAEFQKLGLPLLVGMSRKRMIAEVLGHGPSVDERLSASLALATLATWSGASIIRVHDVKPTVDAVTMVQATQTVD